MHGLDETNPNYRVAAGAYDDTRGPDEAIAIGLPAGATPSLQHAALLAFGELGRQVAMWGAENERADATKGQMMMAAMAQLRYLDTRRMRGNVDVLCLKCAKDEYYPMDWSGFRDYGSDVANLAVAAAYLISEMARKIRNGESTERLSRRPDQAYKPETGLPAVQEF